MPGTRLSISTVNRFVKQAQYVIHCGHFVVSLCAFNSRYAVRGPIALAASKVCASNGRPMQCANTCLLA